MQLPANARYLAGVAVLALPSACSPGSESAAHAGAAGRGGTEGEKAPLPRERALDPRFVKITLHRDFVCEGAALGDLDQDGVTDVVVGPEWYRGPGFGARHEIWSRRVFDPFGYSDCFFQFVEDLDEDGWPDLLVVGFPGQPGAWYKNPGRIAAPWERNDVLTSPIDNESPAWVDITGDGRPELVHMTGGVFGWSSPDNGAREPWVFHALSEVRGYVTFTHGLGVGDLDADGRPDALEATGYFLQPVKAGEPFRRVDRSFGSGGGQMPVRDLDGDGDADVLASLAAHGYGLSWFEQVSANPPAFLEHAIVPGSEPLPDAAVVIHEPHALAIADIDGDGLVDLVTGERFWGHVPAGTPDFSAPGRLYWFRARRTASGLSFEPTLIDDDSGVGTQLTLGDIDGDTRPDAVIANKKGAFVFLQGPG